MPGDMLLRVRMCVWMRALVQGVHSRERGLNGVDGQSSCIISAGLSWHVHMCSRLHHRSVCSRVLHVSILLRKRVCKRLPALVWKVHGLEPTHVRIGRAWS
jgi:hypothetical protein